MHNLLRAYIREILTRDFVESDTLSEPRQFFKDRHDEMSAVAAGAIAGVTTPLGTGPTHPDEPKKKKRKKSKDLAAKSFGGGSYKDS